MSNPSNLEIAWKCIALHGMHHNLDPCEILQTYGPVEEARRVKEALDAKDEKITHLEKELAEAREAFQKIENIASCDLGNHSEITTNTRLLVEEIVGICWDSMARLDEGEGKK